MRLGPGGAVSPHAHRVAHHHLWVVDGSVEVLGEVLGERSYVHIPDRIRHGIVNRGAGSATLLYLYLQPQ